MNNAKNLSRRTFVAAGAVAAGAAALGLSACGGGDKKPAAAANVLTAGFSHSGTNWDPVGASSAIGLPAAVHVFEGLFNFDYADYSVYAALAAEDPKKTADLTYEVTLRKDAKFSDGKAVTAADVVASYLANIDPKTTYPPFLDWIDTVSAKDDTTVEFKLKYDTSLIKERMAMIMVFKADATADDRKAGTIGSGPWMFDQINGEEGGKVTFKPNPEYNGPKPAKAEAMEWSVLVDNTARATAMKEGSIMTMEDVPEANADDIKASGAELTSLDGYCNPFLMFNCTKAPFNDARVRQAFHYAIDTQKLIKNVANGKAEEATSFLPKCSKNYNKAATQFAYDPEKAKALLKEAGQEAITCTLTVNQNWVKDLAAQVQSDLAAVGITADLDIKAIPWSEWSADNAEAGKMGYDVCLTPGDASCFGTDADAVMTWWYDNDIWMKGRTGWQFAEAAACTNVRTLMNEARRASGDAQQQVWNKCFDAIAAAAVIYPLYFKPMVTAVNTKKIAGFKPAATTGMYFLDASVAGK